MNKRPSKFLRPRQQQEVDLPGENKGLIYVADEYGLALDPKAWCKDNCNTCYGRGFMWKRGTRVVAAHYDEKGNKVPERTEPHDEMHPCPSAVERYKKKRKEIEERLHRAKKSGRSEARELEKIHFENGHGIKLLDEKDMIMMRTPSSEGDVEGVPNVPPPPEKLTLSNV
jgi:hypothetical protein